MIIGSRSLKGQVRQQVMGGHDIHDRQAGHAVRDVQRQPMRDTRPTIMANDVGTVVAQMIYQPDDITAHRPKAHLRHIRRFVAVTITPQVRHDHGIPLRQVGGDARPHRAGLGIAVQQDNRRTTAENAVGDGPPIVVKPKRRIEKRVHLASGGARTGSVKRQILW